MNWLLQSDVFDENLEELKEEIIKQGHNFKVVDYSPYESNKEYLRLFSKKDCVLFYGSLNFGHQILKEAPWIPGLFYTPENYLCSSYYPKLQDYLLNKDFMMLPYGCLKDKLLFEHLTRDNHIFIRPDKGSKSFTGQVVDTDDWQKELNKLNAYSPYPDELVLLSSPTDIEREWRFIVSDKVVAWSQYKAKGEHKESEYAPTDVINFAEEVLRETKFRPDPLWTLDICQVGQKYYVLEVGCFSCAGLYKASVSRIVKEASKLAKLEWKDLYE